MKIPARIYELFFYTRTSDKKLHTQKCRTKDGIIFSDEEKNTFVWRMVLEFCICMYSSNYYAISADEMAINYVNAIQIQQKKNYDYPIMNYVYC